LIDGAAAVLDLYSQGAPASSLTNQPSGASFDIGNKIVSTVECTVRTSAAHKVDVACPAPWRRFETQWCIPGITRMCGIDHRWDVRRGLMLPDLFAELCREIAHLIEEGRHVTLLVFVVFVLRQTAAKLGVELRRLSHLGG
jgi:hypothetical protein